MRKFKDVEGYEGLYEVTNDGEVYSLRRYPVIEKLRQYDNGTGYMNINLSKNFKRKAFKVHRLVAKAFVDGYFEGAEVNHKDKNRSNNRADNLEWVTKQQNMEHSHAKTYKFIDPNGEVRNIYNLTKFCDKNGLNAAHMVQVHKETKSYNQHKGWTKFKGE